MESIYRPKEKVAPVADTTAEHTCGILSTTEIKYSLESSSHICCRSPHKCAALVDCFDLILLSSLFQTSLIGFKSGDCAGH